DHNHGHRIFFEMMGLALSWFGEIVEVEEGVYPAGKRVGSDMVDFDIPGVDLDFQSLTFVDQRNDADTSDVFVATQNEKVATLEENIFSKEKVCSGLVYEYGMLACKPAKTPLMSKLVVSNEASENDPLFVNITDYQKLMGKLIYLTNTRPDISYDVHCLSQFMHSHLSSNIKTTFKILRYLRVVQVWEFILQGQLVCSLMLILMLIELNILTKRLDTLQHLKLVKRLAIDTITSTTPLTSNQTLVSNGDAFELGFFSTSDSKNLYVGIWYKQIQERTYVWVANRDDPINSSSGKLTIGENGNVILVDQSETAIWSSNQSVPVANVVAQLLDDGNFVLRRENDEKPENYIWQSFDYPTDTALPKMKLGWSKKTGNSKFLRSWKSNNDPAGRGMENGLVVHPR
nr:receptor-like serine/threonine-protein kinase SD1-8 [Tanacetum cinerariifolium]